MKYIKAIIICLLVITLFTSCWMFGWGSAPVQSNITPSEYKIALIGMKFYSDDTIPTVVDIIPTATAAAPEIVDMTLSTGTGSLQDLLDSATFPTGKTYDRITMTPLYLEMELPTAFHVPSYCSDSGWSVVEQTPASYTIRMYFNIDNAASTNLWKRDIAVYFSGVTYGTKASVPDGWYWMMRVVNTGTTDNFFESIASTHPGQASQDSGINPLGDDSIIDLFSDDAFWGPMIEIDDASIEVTTDSDVDGGMRAEFTPFTLASGQTPSVMVDINYSMNYSDNTGTIAGVTFNANMLDFGPMEAGSSSDDYGDMGFHPFLPYFSFTATAISP